MGPVAVLPQIVSAAVTCEIALNSCSIGRARLMDKTRAALDIAIANSLIDYAYGDSERMKTVAPYIREFVLMHLPTAMERIKQRWREYGAALRVQERNEARIRLEAQHWPAGWPDQHFIWPGDWPDDTGGPAYDTGEPVYDTEPVSPRTLSPDTGSEPDAVSVHTHYTIEEWLNRDPQEVIFGKVKITWA